MVHTPQIKKQANAVKRPTHIRLLASQMEHEYMTYDQYSCCNGSLLECPQHPIHISLYTMQMLITNLKIYDVVQLQMLQSL